MARHDPRRARRSIRLAGFDYGRPGAYFVTICTHRRNCLLGEVIDEEVPLSTTGALVRHVWRDLHRRFPVLGLDASVVMPNHVHGILVIRRTVGAGLAPPHDPDRRRQTGAASRAPTLPDIIGAFKSISTIRVNRSRGQVGLPLWQRGYYEHVIRDEEELNRLRQYIAENPLKWEEDAENPARPRAQRRP